MIKQVKAGGFDDNFSYFLGDDKGNVAVVDPSNVPLLSNIIEEKGFAVTMILLTHSHFDHTEGVADFVDKYGIAVYTHKNARGRINVADDMMIYVDDTEIIKIGDLYIKVLFTPGHADDALCYFVERNNSWDGIPRLITGDTVFVGSCGRADLNGSDIKDLFNSIERIKALPDDTKIYPGHDYGVKPVSTIKWEKEHNRYFKCKSFEEFKKLRLG